MDLVSPLSETLKGYKYIMTITDYYTKWAEAYPIMDKTALSVADVLYSVSSINTHFIDINLYLNCYYT